MRFTNVLHTRDNAIKVVGGLWFPIASAKRAKTIMTLEVSNDNRS